MENTKVLRGACIIGQSGGPTAVINASAYGAIRAGLDSDVITKVYGAAHGIKGVLDDKLYVMDEEDPVADYLWQSGWHRLNGKQARLYASQGQQRSLALALKIAEGDICCEEFGDYPSLLLDDVLSELDASRREYLINKIESKQVIMTSCEEIIDDGAKKIKVENGVYF